MAQDIRLLELDKAEDVEWLWKVDWCINHRLNPHLTWVWEAAGQAYKNRTQEEKNG